MDKKHLFEELSRLETEFINLCKEQKKVIEKLEDNISNAEMFKNGITKFSEYNKKIEKNRAELLNIVQEYNSID